MKRYQKILLGILAGAVLFFGGIQVYLSYYLDQRLETILTNRFATATEGAYELDIREFDLKILGRQINVKDIRLSTKQDSVDYKLQAKLDALNISGIKVLKLLISRKLSLREIELVNPSINFTASTQQNADGRKTKLTDVSRDLSEVILQALENVSVPRLSIRGFSGTYNRRGQPEEPYITFQDSYIQVQNILIDSTQIKGKRILPADHITTVFRNINLRTDNDLYELSADELHFSSDSQQLNIRSIKLAPLLNKEAFAQKVGHETDRITMSIAEINCREINFPKLNQAEGIEAQKISVHKPDIEIYRDKRPPFPTDNSPPLPRQMIHNIPFPIDIDSVSISGGNIRYSERVPEADKAGYVTFTDLNAQIYPFSNVNKQHPMILIAKTNIMDQATLQTRFTFPANTNNHHITGNLQHMVMTTLNKALVPTAFVRIDEGEIQDMNFEIILNETHSTGTVILRYQDLKVSLLDKKTSKEKLGDKLISLLANTFAVKSSNTGDNPRTGTIDFERDLRKSVFNYWWKSLLSGLKSSI